MALRRAIYCLPLLLGGWLPLSAGAADIVEAVQTEIKQDTVDITVDLATPVEVVRHFPSTRGKILQIQLKPRGVEGPLPEPFKKRESKGAGSGLTVLRDVIYEGNVRGGPFLVLRFGRVVSFDVAEANGGRQVRIALEKDAQLLAETGGQPQLPQARPPATGGEGGPARLFREGKDALTRGDNNQAVLLFSEILQMPSNEYTADAKEYLGVARERNGQLELAKQEFEEYLETFPKSPKLNTVRQRLMALETRLAKPRETRREPRLRTTAATGQRRSEMFGRFYQSVISKATSPENGSFSTNDGELVSILDVTQRIRQPGQELRMVASGSYERQYADLDAGEDPDLVRVRSLYVDYRGEDRGLFGVVGRMSSTDSGVYGRFDGSRIGYQLHPKLRINAVAGYPVEYSDPESIQISRPTFATQLNVIEPLPHWNFAVYGVNGQVDGVLNRRAVGGNAQYFQDGRMFSTLVDYDVAYRVLNIATAQFGMNVRPGTRMDVRLDRRRNPILTTSNALYGLNSVEDPAALGLSSGDTAALEEIKQAATIEAMSQHLSEGQIRARALENTGVSTLLTLSMRHDLKKDLQLNSYLSISDMTTNTAALTQEQLDEGTEEIVSQDYSLSNQLVLRNYFRPRDTYLAGVRLSDASTYRRIELSAIGRLPLGQKWRHEARARFQYGYEKRGGTEANYRFAKLFPSYRVDYRWNKRFDLGGELLSEIDRTQKPGADQVFFMINVSARYTF